MDASDVAAGHRTAYVTFCMVWELARFLEQELVNAHGFLVVAP